MCRCAGRSPTRPSTVPRGSAPDPAPQTPARLKEPRAPRRGAARRVTVAGAGAASGAWRGWGGGPRGRSGRRGGSHRGEWPV
ncbi:hypothetical protein EF910_20295 [Streptomyces sp. WAC07149]|nr:hypothetical protein EF910_20295 [Streptomyces sp. WAC07149]